MTEVISMTNEDFIGDYPIGTRTNREIKRAFEKYCFQNDTTQSEKLRNMIVSLLISVNLLDSEKYQLNSKNLHPPKQSSMKPNSIPSPSRPNLKKPSEFSNLGSDRMNLIRELKDTLKKGRNEILTGKMICSKCNTEFREVKCPNCHGPKTKGEVLANE